MTYPVPLVHVKSYIWLDLNMKFDVAGLFFSLSRGFDDSGNPVNLS